MFPSTRELEHDPHPAPLVFRAALGHSGDDAAARCDRSGSRPPRRRPCPCPRAEGLWHAADAGCARHLDQPRRRDALFRDAAGLRRRALLLCGVPHRSRPARALCRGAADPRRGDRPRPDRAFRAVPCAPADPLGPAVDRHRLGAADRRGPRCCRAYDLGQADRPFRSAEYRLAGLCGGAVEVTLVTREALLPSHNRRVRRLFERILAERRVAVLTDSEIVRVEPGALIGDDGKRIAFDEALWVTEAGAARWLAETGLPLTADGFIAIDETLLSTGDPSIFATGDVATMIAHPREKAGVYAVRQGRPLAANLRRALAGRRPRPAVPQRRGLALIGTGDGYAVASRGPFAAYGASWWRLKEWIDRRWMRRYRELPEMAAEEGEDPMRCGLDRARQPGRRRAYFVSWCAACVADRRFFPRHGRGPLSLRTDRRDPRARRYLRDGRHPRERARHRHPAAGAVTNCRARPLPHAARRARRARNGGGGARRGARCGGRRVGL